MSQVASNDGKMIDVEDFIVESSRFYNFVQAYRREYFEDHGLEWCLDQILARGMAEIKRQVKTARERAKQQAAGELLKKFNMTVEQAKQLLEAAASQKQTNGKVAA